MTACFKENRKTGVVPLVQSVVLWEKDVRIRAYQVHYQTDRLKV